MPNWLNIAEEELKMMGLAKDQVNGLLAANLKSGIAAIAQKSRGRKETWCIIPGKGRLGITFVEVDGRPWVQSLTLEHEEV